MKICEKLQSRPCSYSLLAERATQILLLPSSVCSNWPGSRAIDILMQLSTGGIESSIIELKQLHSRHNDKFENRPTYHFPILCGPQNKSFSHTHAKHNNTVVIIKESPFVTLSCDNS